MRGVQSGYLRYYAALLLSGSPASALYFLISRMTIHLLDPALLAARARRSLGGAVAARARAGRSRCVGALVPLAYAVMHAARLRRRRGRPAVRHRRRLDPGRSGIRYKLGVDGLNLWLIALTTLLFAVAALWLAVRPAGARRGCSRSTSALGETAVLGAFLAQDLALFVLFFDLMLVPFYFLVGQWGGPDRVAGGDEDGHLHARRLAADARRRGGDGGAVSARRRPRHASCSPTCARTRCRRRTQKWIFVAFALAFLIKMPAFPFHGWMPDAYRTMPLPALAFFSGVVSKVAAYGFLRIVLPLFPAAAHDFQTRSC